VNIFILHLEQSGVDSGKVFSYTDITNILLEYFNQQDHTQACAWQQYEIIDESRSRSSA
jgi:hypothetical protein